MVACSLSVSGDTYPGINSKGSGMTDDPKSETYTEAETKARAAAALQRMLATPHKPHRPPKAKG